MPPTPPKRIGIAVVEFQNTFLIGVRGPDVPLPGLSEFPGGKCFEGESPEDCAIRECLEETGLPVHIIHKLLTREFEYPHAKVELHFFLCQPHHHTDVASEHRGFRWVQRSMLSTLNFPEANQPVVDMLVSPTGTTSSP